MWSSIMLRDSQEELCKLKMSIPMEPFEGFIEKTDD